MEWKRHAPESRTRHGANKHGANRHGANIHGANRHGSAILVCEGPWYGGDLI